MQNNHVERRLYLRSRTTHQRMHVQCIKLWSRFQRHVTSPYTFLIVAGHD